MQPPPRKQQNLASRKATKRSELAKQRDRSAGRKNTILRSFQTNGSCRFKGQSNIGEVLEHANATDEPCPV
jgi:hypothetical protein